MIVMLSMRRSPGVGEFSDLLEKGAQDDVEYRYFSWPEALRGRYDVLHVHWPELLVRDSRGRARAFLRRRLMDALLLVLRVRGIPLVRTFHNPRPHERGDAAEARALDRIDAATRLWIALNDTTRPEGDVDVVLIPHGHYAEVFASFPQPAAVPGRVAFFGIIRPYKNVEELVAAFRGLDDAALSLRIAGRAHPGQEERVRAAAGDDPRIGLSLRYLDDADLVREVREASLVVLPYREMHNSGALLVAASLGRPVLVPHSGANALLAAELGHGWVRMYRGALTPDVLAAHLEAVAAEGLLCAEGPDIAARDAARIGALHARAYRRARGERIEEEADVRVG